MSCVFVAKKNCVEPFFFKCQTHSLKDLTICVKRALEGAATITQSSETHTKSIQLDISKIYFFFVAFRLTFMYCLAFANGLFFRLAIFYFHPWLLCCCVLFFWSKQITISQCGPSDKFQHQNLFLSLLLTVAEDPFSSKLFGPAGRAR